MNFSYSQKVDIVFGRDQLEQLGQICKEKNLKNGLLVCDALFVQNGMAERVMAHSKGALANIFSGLSPNPDVEEVDSCVQKVQNMRAEFILALGGGSAMDCAKAAAVIAKTDNPTRYFHSECGAVQTPGLPVIAVPTTAGTGSEVTNVAVLSDRAKGIKGPMASDLMYVRLALIDPVLTLSVPPAVTASTGLDVLSHALEGYWSKNHQPICDALAIYAAKLVFDNLYATYEDGANLDAREQMCIASLIAGLSFNHPKTAASHACSFPLTNLYHMPHGEACAFTLDKLIAINCETNAERINTLARMVGFTDADQMAARTLELKQKMGMKCSLAQAGIRTEDLEELSKQCQHPNMRNNPTEMSMERTIALFRSLEY